MALVVATLLAAPFARESDGHLEYALTKPASRLEIGVRTIGVDLAAILIAAAMTVVAEILAQLLFEIPRYDFSDVLPALGVLVFGSAAWYGLLNAVTASMRRGYGAVLGLSWPISLAIVGLSFVDHVNWLPLQLIAAIAKVVAIFLPLRYMQLEPAHVSINGQLVPIGDVTLNVVVTFVLALIYCTVAVMQWRRVEA
jgi:hypothetical protein